MPSSGDNKGYCVLSGVNKTIAFFKTCKSILLFKTIGPVSHIPSGTIKCPPPRSDKSAIAAANAWVFNVMPLPIPPYSARETSSSGIAGVTAFGISKGKPW